MRNRSQKQNPESAAPIIAAGFAENSALLREKGYRPHRTEYGPWYLFGMGIVLLDNIPRAEVLRCFGRKDS